MCTSLPPSSPPPNYFIWPSKSILFLFSNVTSFSIPVNQSISLRSCFPMSRCLSPTLPPSLPAPYLLGPTQLSSALMFDAVHVVVGAVRELNRSQEIGVKPLSCTSPQIWQHGTSLMNYLRMVNPPPPACSHISRHALRSTHTV